MVLPVAVVGEIALKSQHELRVSGFYLESFVECGEKFLHVPLVYRHAVHVVGVDYAEHSSVALAFAGLPFREFPPEAEEAWVVFCLSA